MKKKVMMTVSSPNCKYFIDKAHEMGLEFAIVNNNLKSPLRMYADESYDVDASDTESVVALINEKNIDGIVVTGSDAHLRFYCDICDKANLFCYCSKKQVDSISDKILFKKCCEEHGLNVIPEYTEDNLDDIMYPVMVKSPDNSGGSKGMTLVYERKDLDKAIDYAKANSPTKSVVIEHYIDGDEFVINYFFVNGKPYVLYTKDYCKNIVNGQVMRDNAMISPSKYEYLFYEKADEKLRNMFEDIGMSNGIIFLQCFVENGELYFFEGGCRAGGCDEYFLWNKIFGIDFHKAMLHFAVYGNYGVPQIDKVLSETKQTKIYSVLNVLVSSGTITDIIGEDSVRNMKGVLATTIIRNVGDHIVNDATSGQIAFRVMIEANDGREYIEIVDKIYSTLSFVDENKKNMITPRISLEQWL